jgi:hypothetical protein
MGPLGQPWVLRRRERDRPSRVGLNRALDEEQAAAVSGVADRAAIRVEHAPREDDLGADRREQRISGQGQRRRAEGLVALRRA